MDKHERKFLNTKIKIQAAFSSLLNEIDFEDISISRLCKKANINRSTFYEHYSNIAELTEEIGEEAIARFKEENKEYYAKILNNLNNRILAQDDVLIPYLDFIKQNQTLFKVYNNNKSLFGNKEHEDILKNTIFKPGLRLYGIYDSDTCEYIFAYFINGLNAIINKWVSNGCIESSDKICKIIQLCIQMPER